MNIFQKHECIASLQKAFINPPEPCGALLSWIDALLWWIDALLWKEWGLLAQQLLAGLRYMNTTLTLLCGTQKTLYCEDCW